MIDWKKVDQLIEEKYISVQKHPNLDLYIYNYTQRAQFDRVWNNETKQCRGLITDSRHHIVARPFPKFFNLAEALDKGEQIPAEDFLVTEKMDGSLGILYFDNGFPYLATRGSFVSDQAKVGTKILQSKYMLNSHFNPHYTYLFEIIYPENRIVVDYGQLRDIVLLSIINTATGKEESYEEMVRFAENAGLPYVKKYDGIRDLQQLYARPNSEGYVITFLSGQRFKIKFDEYVRLHRLVTGVNAKTIWEMLKDEKPMEELLERVPDEFYQWVSTTKRDLEKKYDYYFKKSEQAYKDALKYESRKEQALFIIKHYNEFSGVIFAMLSNKPYKEIIWKMVRPKADRPFKEDIDA